MKKTSYFFLAISIAVLSSCGGSTDTSANQDVKLPESPYEKEMRMKDSLLKLPPVQMSFEAALADTLQFDHNVTIEGYFQLPQLSSTSDRGQSMNFYGRRNQMHGNYIYTTVPNGKDVNSMAKLRDKYTVDDVKIMDKNKQVLSINERVKITGRMYASKSFSDPKDQTTYFQVTEIEKVNDVALDYSSLNLEALTEDAAKKEQNYNKAFYIEGKLSIPMFVLTGNEMTIDMTSNNGEKFTVKVMRGTGASQMEDLKENWSKSDVKIRNNKGEIISLNKTVRVYGVLALDGLHIEEIISK